MSWKWFPKIFICMRRKNKKIYITSYIDGKWGSFLCLVQVSISNERLHLDDLFWYKLDVLWYSLGPPVIRTKDVGSCLKTERLWVFIIRNLDVPWTFCGLCAVEEMEIFPSVERKTMNVYLRKCKNCFILRFDVQKINNNKIYKLHKNVFFFLNYSFELFWIWFSMHLRTLIS